jgi:hypothetical protein
VDGREGIDRLALGLTLYVTIRCSKNHDTTVCSSESTATMCLSRFKGYKFISVKTAQPLDG